MGWIIKPAIFVIVVATLVLSYYGLFHTVTIQEKTVGPYVIVYEKFTGDYKKTLTVAKKLNQRLIEEANIHPMQNFGIFFDDPKTTPTGELRSIGGCIFQEGSGIDEDKLSEQFNVAELSNTPCAVTEFPFKGVISILVGTYKVYPKLEEYVQSELSAMGPVMEIYDDERHIIIYNAFLEWYQHMTDQLLGAPERF